MYETISTASAKTPYGTALLKQGERPLTCDIRCPTSGFPDLDELCGQVSKYRGPADRLETSTDLAR